MGPTGVTQGDQDMPGYLTHWGLGNMVTIEENLRI